VLAAICLTCAGRTPLDTLEPTGRAAESQDTQRSRVDARWQPRTFAPAGYWHPADAANAVLTPGIHSGLVPRLPDDSGHGRILSAWNNAAAPTYRSEALGGRGGLIFAVDKRTRLQTAVDSNGFWSCLHDGSGGTIAFIAQPVSMSSCTAVNTSATPHGAGIDIRHDGVLEQWTAEVRGERGATVLRLSGARGHAPSGAPYLVVFDFQRGRRPEEAMLRVNGKRVAGGNATAAPSNEPPGGVLAYGAPSGTNTSFFAGELGQLIVFDRILSSDEQSVLEATLNAVPSARELRVVWTIGDSLTNNTYQSFLYARSLLGTRTRLDFVGSLLGGESPWFVDAEHDGHTGYSIQAIQDVAARVKLTATPTDVVIMAGTNNAGRDLATTLTAYDSLVRTTHARFPSISKERIWLARIPRIATTEHRQWAEAFRALQKSYAERHGYQSWDADGRSDADFVDGSHLNSAGHGYQADRLADAMQL
jgi:hypothetical protein